MKYVTELTNQSTKVRQIQESEKDWTLAMVRQAAENIGEGKIRLLLIDRGYLVLLCHKSDSSMKLLLGYA